MASHTYDRGGATDGTLGVSLDRFYGEEYVCVDLLHGDTAAYLTAAQAREIAADLNAHADALVARSDGGA